MNENFNMMPMLGSSAPRFVADSTCGPIKLTDYIGKWLVLFSHPASFTPVCTTEMISFAKYNDEFKKRNCELVGLSVDSTSSHLAWVKDMEQNSGMSIPFPIISDSGREISQKYGMIQKNVSSTETVRNVFIIDPQQNIKCILIYPMQNGRNISEILRMIDALQMTDKEGVSTPANWMPGLATIVPSPKNYCEMMEQLKKNNAKNCMDWYLCFNKDNNDIRRW